MFVTFQQMLLYISTLYKYYISVLGTDSLHLDYFFRTGTIQFNDRNVYCPTYTVEIFKPINYLAYIHCSVI